MMYGLGGNSLQMALGGEQVVHRAQARAVSCSEHAGPVISKVSAELTATHFQAQRDHTAGPSHTPKEKKKHRLASQIANN